MMHRRARHPGFTLLELVLVMMITATMVAMAAPLMRGWSRGAKLKNSADEFLTICRYGRTMAINEGRVYRLEMDADAGVYQLKVQQGTEFATINAPYGRAFKILDGGKMKVEFPADPMIEYQVQAIDFYPTGRTRAASITISDSQGNTANVRCETPAEDFYFAGEGKL